MPACGMKTGTERRTSIKLIKIKWRMKSQASKIGLNSSLLSKPWHHPWFYTYSNDMLQTMMAKCQTFKSLVSCLRGCPGCGSCSSACFRPAIGEERHVPRLFHPVHDQQHLRNWNAHDIRDNKTSCKNFSQI